MLTLNDIIIVILVALLLYLIFIDDRELEFFESTPMPGAGMGSDLYGGSAYGTPGLGTNTNMGAGIATGSLSASTPGGVSTIGVNRGLVDNRELSAITSDDRLSQNDRAFLTGQAAIQATNNNPGYAGTGSFGASSVTNDTAGRGVVDFSTEQAVGRSQFENAMMPTNAESQQMMNRGMSNFESEQANRRAQYENARAPTTVESQQMMGRGTYGASMDGRTYTTSQYVNAIDNNVPAYMTDRGVNTTVQISPNRYGGQSIGIGQGRDSRFGVDRDYSRPAGYCNVMGNAFTTAINRGLLSSNKARDIWNSGQSMADSCGPYGTY
jgi:hypothetical protein